MSAFAGIVRFDGAGGDSEIEEALLRAIAARQKARPRIRRAPGAAFVMGGEDFATRTAADDGALFAALARLDNRDELGAALAIPTPELLSIADTTLLLRMFGRWGAAGLARCLGAFVFAQWDPQARRLILGRDYLGFNRTLFYYRGRGFAAFATAQRILLALPCVPRELDEVMLADFLAVNFTERRRTFYRGIEHVPTRMFVTIDREQIRHQEYWSPDFRTAQPYRRVDDYIERARELFDQAVATATAGYRKIAISATGGLDSST
ncbi:MAG TPA: hypothetical protein VM782_13290, partial [Stellaceae bacterium]|nr:hypothetical protein [Stellaceae bacterium]